MDDRGRFEAALLRGVMTKRELKKLSRLELLELLLRQMEENEQLRSELEQAQRRLASREIELENAGSIAQASLQISRIFEAAQMAADIYLENVRRAAGEMSK